MPIRINLLAENQAAEDQRRRDPVKRTIWFSGFAVALVLLWCLSIQLKIMRTRSDLSRQEKYWTSIETKHREITENLKRSAIVEKKIASLNRLSTNRFFYGSTLNALQQTIVDQVQAVRLKIDQSYSFVEGVAGKVTAGKAAPAKPAASVEKMTIFLEAKDLNPTDLNYNKYKDALAKFPYFKSNLNDTDALRLTALSKPVPDPSDPNRSYVLFTLEMKYPEISRNE